LTDDVEKYKKFLISLYNEYVEKKTTQFRYDSFPVCTALHLFPSSPAAATPPPTSSGTSPTGPPPNFTAYEIRRELENSPYPIESIRSMDTLKLITDCKDDNDV
jgi:hypothetical protein